MYKGNEMPDLLSSIEFQVLLVLSDQHSYGYAIMQAVERQTGGRFSPEIGSLYRVLSRLMARGLVGEQAAPEGDTPNHRGLPRKYYGLTAAGRRVLREEAEHLAAIVDVAKSRDILG
jgi:DNA-binding PadR family transcriptional regulator